jgi:Tfp pilus assembly protein PilF
MMAIVQSPKRVQVIDLASDSELASFDASDPRQINHLCFSPDGSRLAAGCDHQTIQVWDLRAIRGELAAMGLDWDSPHYPAPMAGDDRMPLRIKVDMGTPPTADLSSPSAQVGLNSFLLAMSPFNYQAYMQRGIAHTRLREWRPAIDDFSMVLTLLPSDAKTRVRALVQRSYNYGQIKDYSRTLDDLQQALKLDPDDLQACNNLAWLYATGPENLRSPELALPLAQKAVDKAANKWEFLNTLGVVFYRLGKYEQAIATLERSLREGNNQAAAFDLFFLAMCHARLGDAAKAQDCYDRAVQWIQEHQDQVTPEWAEELKAFHAEADDVLAKSGPGSQDK